MASINERNMKPYRAIGRRGAGIVRLFDSPMTHAVDIDGSVEQYFSSESQARDFAFEMFTEGRDAVVVAATPCDTTPATSWGLQGTFTEKLKNLLGTVTSPAGKPYTRDDLVDSLHDQGIPLASRLVDRLLAGIGGQPPDRTVAAVARFFGLPPEALDGRSAATRPLESGQQTRLAATAMPAPGVWAKARNNDPSVPFNTRRKPFQSGTGFAVDIRVRDYNGAAAKRYAEGVIIGFWESEKQARRVADEVNSGKRFEPGHHLHSRAHSAIVVPAWNVSESRPGGFPWETPEGSAAMVAAYTSAGVPLPQWLLETLSRLDEPSDGLVATPTTLSPEHVEVGRESDSAADLLESSQRGAGSMGEDLLTAIRGAVEVGEIILTLGTSRPNRIASIDESGIRVATEKSERNGNEPQLVPAWMIESAWDHLSRHGGLTQNQLVDELNVKRSAFICALLSRLPDVEYESVPRVALRLVRDDDVTETDALDEAEDGVSPPTQELSREFDGSLSDLVSEAAGLDTYSDRLNHLFETVHPNDRGSYSSGEVAAALQADGISLHANSIARLRGGVGAPPQEAMTQALAYFFNVDPDYLFSGSTASFDAENGPLTVPTARPQSRSDIGDLGRSGSAPQSSVRGACDARPDAAQGSYAIGDEPASVAIRLSTSDLLRLSAGLSQAAHSASQRPHTDLGLIRRFVTLVAEAAAFLQESVAGDVSVPVRYLEHALVEWDETEPADNGTEPAFRWLAELLNRHLDR